jgi:hypothetical protein
MKLIIEASRQFNTVNVDPNVVVRSFKNNLQAKYPYIKKTSFFNKKTSKYIDDDKSFIENGLKELDELLIILRLSGSYELQVNIFNNILNIGRFISITVDSSDTIKEVTQKIIDNVGINIFENRIMTLSYDNIILDEEEMLRNYSINENSVINCFF